MYCDYFHVVHSPAVNHDPVNSFGAARRGWLTVAIFKMLQHLHTGHQKIHVYVLLCKVSLFGGGGHFGDFLSSENYNRDFTVH